MLISVVSDLEVHLEVLNLGVIFVVSGLEVHLEVLNLGDQGNPAILW
jgi:hypothetical protein